MYLLLVLCYLHMLYTTADLSDQLFSFWKERGRLQFCQETWPGSFRGSQAFLLFQTTAGSLYAVNVVYFLAQCNGVMHDAPLAVVCVYESICCYAVTYLYAKLLLWLAVFSA